MCLHSHGPAATLLPNSRHPKMFSEAMQNKQRRLQPLLPGAALAAPWEMSQAQFEAQAVCAAVDAVMSRGKLQLQAAGDEDRQALEWLQELAALNAPSSVADPAAWAAAGVQRLLAHDLEVRGRSNHTKFCE